MTLTRKVDKVRAELAQLIGERKAAWSNPNLFHEKFHAGQRKAAELRKLEQQLDLQRTRPAEPSASEREEAAP